MLAVLFVELNLMCSEKHIMLHSESDLWKYSSIKSHNLNQALQKLMYHKGNQREMLGFDCLHGAPCSSALSVCPCVINLFDLLGLISALISRGCRKIAILNKKLKLRGNGTSQLKTS